MNQKAEKAKDALIALLAIGMGVCVALTVWAIFLRQPQAAALVPDRAPEQVEPNQTPMQGEETDLADGNTGSGVHLKYSTEVSVSITGAKASLYFGNAGDSAVDIVLQLVVQDQVLAQSARLTPGNEVNTLDLVEGAAARLSKGGYDGELWLFYYDQDNGERSILNTKIPVKVEVVR